MGRIGHTRVAAAVAGLASGRKRTAVGSSAVTGDVTELAAGVALHGLGLAVAGVVVGATALVAGGGTAGEAGAVGTAEAAAHGGSTHGATETAVGGAVTGLGKELVRGDKVEETMRSYQMAGLSAAVASASSAGAGEAKGRAVSLDVTEALAVVALLGVGGTGLRASVGLVAWRVSNCTCWRGSGMSWSMPMACRRRERWRCER